MSSEDWKERLRTFQKVKDQEQIRALYEAGQFRAVVERCSQPANDEELRMVAESYYALMKEACAECKMEEACDYAKKAVQSSHLSTARRSLTQERLNLLRHELPTCEGAPLERFAPGLVQINTFSPIPVLGRYGTWGHKGTLDNLIRLLKKAPEELDSREERTRPRTINRIGSNLFEVLYSCGSLQSVDLILPIPSDAARYATRGYSQQAEVARALAAYSAIPMYTNVLRKTRSTRSIHTLSSPAERETELADSMGVPQEKRSLIQGQVVLLIDDVVTYGTHFKEARKVLVEAGASGVLATAIAAAREYTPLSTLDLS